MRIGVDARLINEKGLGRYIKNLLVQLAKIDSKNEYFIFLLKDDYHSLKFPENFQKVLVNFRWYTLKEQTEFPKILKSLNLDILHVPHFNVPVFYSGNIVVTIHDLIHQHIDTKHASTHNILVYKLKKFGYRQVFKKAVIKSKKIITVSKFVKDQLEKEWNISNSRVEVTYEGVDDNFTEAVIKSSRVRQDKILKELGIRQPFLFYVGNAHPHKNIEGLISAFLEIRKSYQYIQLVLAGDDNFFWPRLKRKYKHQDIIFTGKITDEQLAVIYKNAQAFVTASLEEGFGLPLLEAFTAHCPVVSSSRGSLPEIGGDAAVYFDPTNMEEMISKITQVLNSDKLRQALIEKADKRVKYFSWEKMAKETLKIYQQASSLF